MTSATIHRPDFRQHSLNRVAYVAKADVISFAEHLPPVERADLHCRQASEILALSHRLYWSAYLAAINAALCIAVAHVPNNGRSTNQCRTETLPEEFAGASARKLQPDEPA